MTARDPILDELYATRQKMLEECGFDLAKLVERQRSIPIPATMRLVSIEEVRALNRQQQAEQSLLQPRQS